MLKCTRSHMIWWCGKRLLVIKSVNQQIFDTLFHVSMFSCKFLKSSEICSQSWTQLLTLCPWIPAITPYYFSILLGMTDSEPWSRTLPPDVDNLIHILLRFQELLNGTALTLECQAKELVISIDTMQEFERSLVRQKIMVYTNQKNLVLDSLDCNSDKIIRLQLQLKECGPETVHIAGMINTVIHD